VTVIFCDMERNVLAARSTVGFFHCGARPKTCDLRVSTPLVSVQRGALNTHDRSTLERLVGQALRGYTNETVRLDRPCPESGYRPVQYLTFRGAVQ
jgi:hypothetical protein